MTEQFRIHALVCLLSSDAVALVGLLRTLLARAAGADSPRFRCGSFSPSPLPSRSDRKLIQRATKTRREERRPYNWVLVNGFTLPPGLTLSGAGLISGTPTAQGDTTFNVTVTDSGTPRPLSPPPSPLRSITSSPEISPSRSTDSTPTERSWRPEVSPPNGQGSITAGFEDSNSVQGPPASHSFTGTYTIGSE